LQEDQRVAIHVGGVCLDPISMLRRRQRKLHAVPLQPLMGGMAILHLENHGWIMPGKQQMLGAFFP